MRYRLTISETERLQIRWVGFGILMFAIGIILYAAVFLFWAEQPDAPRGFIQLIFGTIMLLSTLPLPLSITTAILRYRLWNIDIIIRKTITYGALTGLVVLVYAFIVGGTTTALQSQNNVVLSLLALGAASIAFVPARRRLTQLVDRYLPYTPPPRQEENMNVASVQPIPIQHDDGSRYDRRLVSLSRLVFAFCVALFIVGWSSAILISQSADLSDTNTGLISDAVNLAILVVNGAVALLIIAKHPRHSIGWFMLVVSATFALRAWASIGDIHTEVPFSPPYDAVGDLSYWVGRWIWMPLTFGPIMFFALYFPTGRLISRRWRIVALANAAFLIGTVLTIILHPGPYPEISETDINPFPIAGGLEIAPILDILSAPFFVIAFIGTPASMILRYRRAEHVERTQLKWLFYPLGILATWLLFSLITSLFIPGGLPEYLTTMGIWLVLIITLAIPVTIGIAILRHRLFDIDIIIRKTLIYGALTGLVVLTYVLIVGGTTTALQSQNNLVLSLLALGAAAVAFVPARRRLTQLVDRYMPYTPPEPEPDMDAAISIQSITPLFQTERWDCILRSVTRAVAAITLTLVVLNIISLTMLVGRVVPELTELVSGNLSIWLSIIAINALAISVGIAIVRHKLFDIDIIIRKTLIYGALTGLVVLVYALIVSGVTTALQTQNNVMLSLLALGAAGVAFVPARRRLTQMVDHYMPYTPPPKAEDETDDIPNQITETQVISRWDNRLIFVSRLVFAVTLVLYVFGIMFVTALAAELSAQLSVVDILGLGSFVVVAFGIVGVLIISKYPRHAVGWASLFLSIMLALSVIGGILAVDFVEQGLDIPDWYNPTANILMWIVSWNWATYTVGTILFFTLYFPTGRLISKRWRWIALAGAGVIVLGALSSMLRPPDDWGQSVPDPSRVSDFGIYRHLLDRPLLHCGNFRFFYLNDLALSARGFR